MYIHERISSILKKKNLTQKNLADGTGIKQSTISDWKSKNTNPSADALIKISEFLNVSLDYLMIGKESNSSDSQNSEELILLEEFRQLDPQERRIIMGKISEMNYNKRGNAEIEEEIGIHFPVNSRVL